MDERPARDFFLTICRNIVQLPNDDKRADYLERVVAALQSPDRNGSDGEQHRRRGRHVLQPPDALRTGIALVNRLRTEAAEAVVRSSMAIAADQNKTLAPAQAFRKQRGLDRYTLTARYRGADGIIHRPAWVLPDIDTQCARFLLTWSLYELDTYGLESPAQAVSPPLSALRPGDALVIGTVVWAGGSEGRAAAVISVVDAEHGRVPE